MANQCSWCQAFDGQTYWKVIGGIMGGEDGTARGIVRLKKKQADIMTGGRRVVVDVSFCSKDHADRWKDGLGGRFFEWVKPEKKPAKGH